MVKIEAIHEDMKWYNSVRTKLIGFFLAISVVFIVTMISTISIFRQNAIVKNAEKEIHLATTEILSNFQLTRFGLEKTVLALASASVNIRNKDEIEGTVRGIISSNDNSIISSGGVWFEPYITDSSIRDKAYFFDRGSDGKLSLIPGYEDKTPVRYSDMEFYQIATHLKDRETYWTRVYIDSVTKVRMLTVVAPIYRDDTFIGVASLDIEALKHSRKIFAEFKFPDRYLMMIDRDGNIIMKSRRLQNYLKSNKLYDDNNSLDDAYREAEVVMGDYVTPIEQNKSAVILRLRENTQQLFRENILFLKDDPVLKKDSIVAIFTFPQTDEKIIIGIPKEQVLDESNSMYMEIIRTLLYLTLLSALVGYFLLSRLFIKPIEDINKQLGNNSKMSETKNTLLFCKDRGEIGILVDSLNYRTKELTDSMRREKEEIHKRIINDKLLLQQSKMAEMGGMMDAVAHQWKQPLNALSMYSEIIGGDFEAGEVDRAYIEQFHDDVQLQINHMVNTLDEFRTFFRPNKKEESFELLSIVNSVLFLTKDELMKNAITVNILRSDTIELFGYKNEFKHLILNIINNAKDAFNENEIKDRTISFSLINDSDGKRVEIRDNAGGVPEALIDDIFKAHVTTKPEGKGTGIGLYMSMQIATKHNATLSVHNENGGACFVVRFDS